MREQLLQTLTGWLDAPLREPLFLGGLPGVGKTTFVRQLARRADRTLARVPLAERPQLQAVFENGDPGEILRRLAALRGMPALDAGCLLLLDDLHAIPEAAAGVPPLHEHRPDLAILCAGSPMRITRHCECGLMPPPSLARHTLHPLTFTEFLEAVGETKLRRAVDTWHLDAPLGERAHQRLMHEVVMYYFVGGLPDAVRRHQGSRDVALPRLAHSLAFTALDSEVRAFGDPKHLMSMAHLLDFLLRYPTGRMLKAYGRRDSTDGAHFRKGVERLCRGGVFHKVVHTDAAALADGELAPDTGYTMLAPDIGLMSSKGHPIYWEGMSHQDLPSGDILARQLVGQELRAALPAGQQLLFWSPRTGSADGEDPEIADRVDFVLQAAGTLVPVQTCGQPDRRQGLARFVAEKKVPLAVSLGDHPPSMRTVRGKTARYRLLSLPLYLAGALPRILGDTLGG